MGCLLCALGLTLYAGCDDQAEQPSLQASLPAPADAGPRPDPPEPPAPYHPTGPEDVCARGDTRCPVRGGVAVRRCEVPDGAQVTRWIDGRCPDGEVCLDGCQPFACTAGQPVCADAATVATCGDDGASVTEPVACPGDGVCRGGDCVDLCASAQQRNSYIGCEYIAVQLPNEYLESDARIRPHIGLVIANPERDLDLSITVIDAAGAPARALGRLDLRDNFSPDAATVRSSVVSSGQTAFLEDGPVEDLVVPAGGIATLVLTPRGVAGFRSEVAPAGLRLTSTRPVVAYQFNPLCCSFSYSNDASLLLPVEALDREYTFLGAPDWSLGNQRDWAPQGLTIAAAVDGTEVLVTLPDGAQLQPGDVEVNTLTDGIGRVETTLAAGEVLHLASLSTAEGRHHLDGATITSSEPVAVFSDHVCTNIPHSKPACDHLEEQLIPRSTWGRQYMLAPVARRSTLATEVTYWRIVAGPAGAVLTLGVPLRDLLSVPPFSSVIPDCRLRPQQPGDQHDFVLGPGEDCMLGTRYGVALGASEPVMVLGFLVGQKAAAAAEASTATGDPAMFLLPPAAQFRDSYTFLTPSTYASDYVTLIAPASAVGGFTLDGQPVDGTADSVRADRLGGSDHVALHVPVDDGAHEIEGTAPFGLLVYAYDQYVSYAYSGGLDLVKRR